MRVRRIQLTNEHDISFELLDDDDQPILCRMILRKSTGK